MWDSCVVSWGWSRSLVNGQINKSFYAQTLMSRDTKVIIKQMASHLKACHRCLGSHWITGAVVGQATLALSLLMQILTAATGKYSHTCL